MGDVINDVQQDVSNDPNNSVKTLSNEFDIILEYP